MLTLLHELHKDACGEGLPMLVDEILNVAKVLHRFGPRVFAVRSPEILLWACMVKKRTMLLALARTKLKSGMCV